MATTYWVSATGGTTTTLCEDAAALTDTGIYLRTIAAGVNCAVAGDTVEVKPGTYSISAPIVLTRNTVNLHSTVKNGAIIDGQNTSYANIRVNGNSNVIDGFKIWRGYYFGVEMNGSNNTIENCEIANTGNTTPAGDNQGHAGVFSNSGTTGNTYRQNYIHDNGRTLGLQYYESDHGLYLTGSNETMIANIVTHNSGGGAHLAGYTTWTGKLYNNVFAYNLHGIWFWQQFGASEIKNNILYANRGDGISSFAAHGGPIAFDRNISNGNAGAAFNYTGDGSNYTYTAGTEYTSDPRFTNPGSEIYTLEAGSPALDTGAPLGGAPYNADYTGVVRPQNGLWDIGVYEVVVAPVSPRLVLALSLDAGSGTQVLDSSGSGNHGNFGLGVSWDNAGKYGKALSFDGTGAVTIPNSTSLDLTSAMTVEAWVYATTAFDLFKAIVVKNYTYYLYAFAELGFCPASQAAVAGFSSTQPNFVCDVNSLPVNTWTHLAVTFDGATLTYYRGGDIVSTTNPGAAMKSGNGTLQIGGSQFGEYFQGKIDEVRVYNYARTQAQIQSDMNTPLTGGGVPRLTIAAGSSIKMCATCSIKLQAQ